MFTESLLSNGSIRHNIIKHYAMKNWGQWRYGPNILDFGKRLSWVVSFTTLPLYSQEKSTRCPLDGRQSGPQIRSGLYGVENNLLTLPGHETQSSRLSPRCSINWAIPAPWDQSFCPNVVEATNESETELFHDRVRDSMITWDKHVPPSSMSVLCVCGQNKIKCSYLSLLQIL
jgi:hypothetical protein